MQLQPGVRVGPFEIVARLGAGGMGEVFRARDTWLERDVALKVLPDLFATDAERLARFRREAQVLASLNHPHIAAIFRESAPSFDLMMLSLSDPTHRAEPLLHTPSAEQNAEVSPDGRWLAYQSNESGRFEIYVRPFPDVNAGHWQISTDGGSQPAWAKKGDELFFLAPNGVVMAVRVDNQRGWKAGNPVKLFDDRYYHGAGAGVGRTYDVTADKRFLMIKPGGDSPDAAALIVVQNWFAELGRLARPQ